jgi:hypothetical protein
MNDTGHGVLYLDSNNSRLELRQRLTLWLDTERKRRLRPDLGLQNNFAAVMSPHRSLFYWSEFCNICFSVDSYLLVQYERSVSHLITLSPHVKPTTES